MTSLAPATLAAIRERVDEDERYMGAIRDLLGESPDEHSYGPGHDDYDCAARDRRVLLAELDRRKGVDVERLAAAIHTTGIANCAVECKDPPEFGGFSGADYDFALMLIQEYERLSHLAVRAAGTRP